MHAGTFLGGAWGRVWVFVFGFLAFRAFRGFRASGGSGDLAVLLRVNVLCNNVSIARKGRSNLAFT